MNIACNKCNYIHTYVKYITCNKWYIYIVFNTSIGYKGTPREVLDLQCIMYNVHCTMYNVQCTCSK